MYLIWLILFTPLLVICGIIIFVDKKSPMAIPDEEVQRERLGEINRDNSSGNGIF